MGSGDTPPWWRISVGSDSGHQSRFVRPSNERTVVGRSTGQPIGSPVFASMILTLLANALTERLRACGHRQKRTKFVSESRKIDQPPGCSVHMLDADAQIIVAGHERQRGGGPQADNPHLMHPRRVRECSAEDKRSK